jgi:predicted phosphodiesterase
MGIERRSFIKNLASGLAGISLVPGAFASGNFGIAPSERKMVFGVCSDVHHDLFYGADKRLAEFVGKARENGAGFIVQLGDFCFPEEKNRGFLSVWNSFGGPGYHVLGNHDMDTSTKEETLRFLWGDGERLPYYSFDEGEYHFVVLDPNNILSDDGFIPFRNGNYFSSGAGKNNFITPDQLEWLKQDLSGTDKPTIILSHQSVNMGIQNKEQVAEILEKSGKVIACFSGHHHGNWHVKEGTLNHIQINSMCYQWVGDAFAYEGRFPADIERQYPNLKRVLPYRDALYAFVELDPETRKISITGVDSEFIPPGPEELGMEVTGLFPPSSSIDSRIIWY